MPNQPFARPIILSLLGKVNQAQKEYLKPKRYKGSP